MTETLVIRTGKTGRPLKCCKCGDFAGAGVGTPSLYLLPRWRVICWVCALDIDEQVVLLWAMWAPAYGYANDLGDDPLDELRRAAMRFRVRRDGEPKPPEDLGPREEVRRHLRLVPPEPAPDTPPAA